MHDAPHLTDAFSQPLKGERSRWAPFNTTRTARLLAHWVPHKPGITLLVADDPHSAHQLEALIRFFAPDLEILQLPEWETLPYDRFSPHQEIISERLRTLYRLPRSERALLIATPATLMQRLPPVDFVQQRTLLLATGDRLDPQAFAGALEERGYQRVAQVMEPGEFAVRGAIIDLFPMGSPLPYRIDLFDDEIETLRTFDPDTQRSLDRVERIELLPAREFSLDEDGITRFRQQARQVFGPEVRTSQLYQDISEGRPLGGLEYWLPLFHEQTATLFDYLPAQTHPFLFGQVIKAAEANWHAYEERYDTARLNRDFPPLLPERLILRPDEMIAALKRWHTIELQADTEQADAVFDHLPLPDLTIQQDHDHPLARLNAFVDRYEGRVCLVAESPGRREALLTLLRRQGLKPQLIEDWAAFEQGDAPLALCVGPVDESDADHRLALIAESAIFGQALAGRRQKVQRPHEDFDTAIRNLAELEPGMPVVHIQHGVGRYEGLTTLEHGGHAEEFLVLRYANDDRLYVPVTHLELISRYTGASPENAPLHRLGTDKWRKAKEKAARQARDAAAELLDIYARRAAREGTCYEIDEVDYARFAAGFPFEETPDQQAAIEAVLADLQSPQPMDRLVCGDVGFGKTEVALRAAFVVASAGRQVAVLVPTTLLAQQHYDTFADRFADWPIRVGLLSRFQSQKEQKETLAALAEGKIDIIIGTHRLLQKSVKFRDLGLVILDEEHRFGVRQKEQLKKLRAEVDVLTLTATPIPRTLNMAMNDLRSLSIIATPPARRLSVETFVQPWRDETAREACLRELRRGGQVYVLFNDVDRIDDFAEHIRQLVPEGRVGIAHGQMPERQLERVMHDFYHQKFNILVCTTIIETGIDVPSANTILIHRADRFGMAQLHQLRGRVGRSHHRAFAYLFTPQDPAQMTPNAHKRLEAIARHTTLGAGFLLANHDLEIRGAGELLGEKQAGQMQEVGFSLYQELLERAVRAYKAGQVPDELPPEPTPIEIDLGVPALIPEDYLPDVATRLVLYKRIASAENEQALDALQVEMIDRFGLLPEPVKNLFAITALKLRARQLGLTRIDAGEEQARIVFAEQPHIDPLKLIQLIQNAPQRYRLKGQQQLTIFAKMPDIQTRLDTLHDLFKKLAPDA
ncbi:transcription-repair coupling factor [Sulfurivirga sp.]|uniref:transcription-repair coupling factor n=1 Tax=Sulfurivirga sp. TaxID=2614236 RepID=UPI0025DA710B|nr:transcription-repair coupling factor [Sulfurivirga sp.]